jgi:hypothetical protein
MAGGVLCSLIRFGCFVFWKQPHIFHHKVVSRPLFQVTVSSCMCELEPLFPLRMNA